MIDEQTLRIMEEVVTVRLTFQFYSFIDESNQSDCNLQKLFEWYRYDKNAIF